MTWLRRVLAGIALAASAVPAAAQAGADGDKFISFVREGNTAAALSLLQSKPNIIDAADSRGETALLIAIKKRDMAWTAHLLREGANPNLAARSGETPLIAAARLASGEAAGWLLGVGAKVDATNKMGETALIVAVQQRSLPLVKLLLSAGADPDRTDAAAGYSARDYAKRESRFPELLSAIEAGKGAARPNTQPKSDDLDDFKLN
jgi:uncharacterized protein